MYWIILIIIGFIAVHLFKLMRLYLVLMEHRIPLGEFLLLYFRTTLVNLIIPFKLGELYRFEEISRKTRLWQVGVLSVLVDRFYDTAALFVLLLPVDLVTRRGVSFITGVFFAVLLLASFVYLAIPGTYAYLNRYLIMRKSSPRSMAALRGLDVIKNWYDFTKNLIKGRAALISFASFLGWIAEIAALKAIACYLGQPFGLQDFTAYVGSVFQAGDNPLKAIYTQWGVAAMAACTVTGYLIYFIRRMGVQSTEGSTRRDA